MPVSIAVRFVIESPGVWRFWNRSLTMHRQFEATYGLLQLRDTQEMTQEKHETSRVLAMLARLRDELDLAIISIFGGTAALVIAAFGVYRLLSDNLIGVVLDVAISLGLFGIVAYAWRGRNVALAGALFVGFSAIACAVSTVIFGRTATYWAYLVLSIGFVVTGPRAAMIGSLGLIFIIAAQPELFVTLPERVVFVVTALLVAGYGWFFNASYHKQRRQLEALAHEDPLTRAGNRRRMRQALIETVSSVRSTDRPALLAVLDLDRFKAVNDAYGHEMGDKVLVKFADIIRSRLRSNDGFYRLGGEEFVVLLRSTSMEEGRPVLEDLRRLVKDGMQTISMSVTVSIGAVSMRGSDDWSSWLRQADAAMYQAKETGRNRVVIHDMAESEAAAAKGHRAD